MLDGKYFTVAKRDKLNVVAVCTICGRSRKGTVRSTGNFMDHYKTSHPAMVKEIDLYRKDKLSNGEKNPKKQTTLTKSISALSIQVVCF